jgi:hypothetical protein
LMIYEAAMTQLVFIISESTGVVGAKESTRHLWNRFQ